MLVKLILFFLLAATSSNAQVLKGTWTGNYAQSFFDRIIKLELEFKITKDSIITGKSHLYYENNGYELHEIRGKYRKKDSIAYFEETLEATSVAGAAPVVYLMKLIDEGTQWRLQGFWKWKTKKDERYPRSNTVWLVKPKKIIAEAKKPKPSEKPKVTDRKTVSQAKTQTKPKQQIAKKTQPAIRPKPDVISTPVVKTKEQPKQTDIKPVNQIIPDRATNDVRLKKRSEVQSTIAVTPEEKESIEVAIYDNGEIDNDSITIYFNNRLLKQQFRISAVPYSFRISLEDGRSNEIKIVAENMGSIPPNTALMIITTKRKRHEVRLSSNLEKNAVVRFVVD